MRHISAVAAIRALRTLLGTPRREACENAQKVAITTEGCVGSSYNSTEKARGIFFYCRHSEALDVIQVGSIGSNRLKDDCLGILASLIQWGGLVSGASVFMFFFFRYGRIWLKTGPRVRRSNGGPFTRTSCTHC